MFSDQIAPAFDGHIKRKNTTDKSSLHGKYNDKIELIKKHVCCP